MRISNESASLCMAAIFFLGIGLAPFINVLFRSLVSALKKSGKGYRSL